MRGELLSYVFFEHDFFASAIEMGQRDAQRMLEKASGEIPWQVLAD